MVKCPWGCGWEGTPEMYSKHLETCSRYFFPEQIGATEKYGYQTPKLLIKLEVGLVKDDRLLQEAFNELNRTLSGPPLVLEVHRRRRFYAILDAYAGIEGKVILTINESKKDQISADLIAAELIHEIMHHKFPEALELETQRKTEESWKTLFPTTPFPSEYFEVWKGLRKWQRRAGMEI